VASLVVGLISGIITLFSIDAIIEAQIATMGSSLPSGQNHDSLKAVAIGAAIFGLIFSVLIQGLFILFWHLGHGWARIVLTVLAAFTVWNLISSFLTLGQTPVGISLLSILSDLLFLAGAYLAWNKSITAWLQQRKAARTAAMYAG
jgi:protein-S-isoprenylcysteine O-methyltransferase Ste14